MVDYNYHQQEVRQNGFTVIEDIYTDAEVAELISIIDKADKSNPTFRKSADLFAIRQFLKEVPDVKLVVFNYKLKNLISNIFGDGYFAVKSIYLDKPEQSNWFVAWHQDLTISVDRKIELAGYTSWTNKHNQFAVQPPIEILKDNFTIRIHLDDTNADNGALKVLSGSHLKNIYRPENIDWSIESEAVCEVRRGGAMIMRPLLMHASDRTVNEQKRRVIQSNLVALNCRARLSGLRQTSLRANQCIAIDLNNDIYANRIMHKLLTILLIIFCLNAHSQDKTFQKQIDDIFKAYDKKTSPGYAVAVVKGQKVLYAKGFGSANLDYQLPITIRSGFDIASVSKQFTGACIALLIMDGKLSLDMPASRFIPELEKYKDTITIAHLLYNTSGITDYYKLPREDGRSWVTFNYFDNDECIRTSLKPDTLAFKPGTRWDYCNVNFMLLTKIVEKVSGMPFRQFAQKRIFEPLQMNHTLVNDDNTEIIPNRVTPYNQRSKEIVDAYRKEGFKVNYGTGWIQHPRNSPHYGGSGISTTTEDLVKWEENFFSKQFGGERFYNLMHQTRHFANGRDNQAFGLYRDDYKGKIYWAWDGGDFGVSAQAIHFPKEKVAIIVLSNIGTGNAAEKAQQVAAVLYADKILI